MRIRRTTNFEGAKVWCINSHVCSVYFANTNWRLAKHLWWAAVHTMMRPYHLLRMRWLLRGVDMKKLTEFAASLGPEE
jgi:hypothetical protein